MELQLKKMKETKNEEITLLNNKIKESKVKFNSEKEKLMSELEKAKSENNSNETIRNLM